MTVRLEVYLLESTLAFDRLYTYLADETLPGGGQRFRRGMFVVVPFGIGNRRTEAVIWNVAGADDSGADNAEAIGAATGRPIVLKHILEVPDEEPLTGEELEFALRLWRTYACTPGTAIRCIRPFRGKKKAVARTVEVAELAISRADAQELVKQTKVRSIWQLKLLEMLAERGSADVEKLLFETEAKRPQLTALVKKGYVKLCTREAGAEDIKAEPRGERELLTTYPEHELNPKQAEAYNAVKAVIDANMTRAETDPEANSGNGVFLLHGVTGSGKTEVYMHLIAYVLSRGGYVIMMVPEIALTPQMIAHFTRRFGDNVALWHSGLSNAVREREWYRMKKGIARVAVCTRSGIFAPFPRVDLVIVDEVHDGSYRSEESGLRYDAKEVAELRFAGKAAILYGSATPDVTMYYRAEQGAIRLLELPSRAGAGRLPDIQVADMRDERANLARGGLFSAALLNELKANYQAGGQTMLFVGRRGYSARLFCRECGRTMICRDCGLPMTYHSGAARLLCNYCGKAVPAPKSCPKCGSNTLGYGSPGTERVETELRRLFPDAEVLRMDSDTVKVKGGHGALLRRFQKERIPFLVGTQMITKGHDFPGVTLVGIVDADGQINRPEYDAGERAYQIITQVAGRAGRGAQAGKVVVQTYSVDNAVLQAAAEGNYGEFYRRELEFRRAMYYPPFCSLGIIRVSSENDRGAYDCLEQLAAAIRGDIPADKRSAVCVLGPSREPVPKVNGRYRWQLTVKAPEHAEIIQLFFKHYGTIKRAGDIRLALNFDN
ncbi:MAG: primosomal protein N' [Clostridia bacterium]|nr:primosomal protein N' [Clostridia bacterium]